MAKGRVKWFDPKKGFGFVLNDDGMDIFVHYSEIDQKGFKCLRTGQEVEFTLIDGVTGLQGKSVKVISDPDEKLEPESAED